MTHDPCPACHEGEKEPSMTEPIMQTVQGDGVKIQLAIREGRQENILCIHGLTANSRCWDPIVSALAPEYRVLALDLRGRGLSDKPPKGYSIPQHVEDIRHILREMGLGKVTLMGHSLGAYISLAFAARYPEHMKRLILVDAGGVLSQTRWNNIVSTLKPSLDRFGQVFPSTEAYLDLMKTVPFFKSWTPALDTYYRYEVEAVGGGVRSRIDPAHIQEERENLGKVDVSRFYEKISCPVLILRATEGMVAEDDLLLPQDVVERMVQKIPHARYVDIPGTNHYSIVFEQNEVRDSAILGFVAD
jgi:pimeloyl-ACP methyl ester carboxylesterase